MKKYLALLLFLLLLLSGCANQEPEQSQGTTTPLVTLPPAYYEENSAIEVATTGAVKQYNLPDEGYSDVMCAGHGLLLIADGETAKLQMLTGETCIPSASMNIEQLCPSQRRALSNGFAYFDRNANTIRYLDLNLSQRHSVVLAENMTSPVISQDGSQIYYCTGQEIRAMDVSKNISRLVKVQNVAKQTLLDICFNDEVLVCAVEDESGSESILYISARDGKNITTENGISQLYTNDGDYLAYWVDGVVEQWVFGSREGAAVRFVPKEAQIRGVSALGGAIGYEQTEAGLQLSFYDLASGKKTAQILMENIGMPDVLREDPRANCIWLIAEDQNQKQKVLLRWDLKASAVTEDTVYTQTLYTAENPDTEALKALQSRAEEMNTKYGVRIRIWQDALSVTAGHTLIPEYHAPVIEDMLNQLEAVLQEFPKNFVQKSIRSRLRISLVRSADGATDVLQYWNGRDAYVALSAGSDVRTEFLKGFGFVVDSHVLGNSPVYDYWDTLNPTGFVYGKPDASLTTGENPTFISEEAMTSGMHDRAIVFWQAMEPDNAAMFQGETMQKKLQMLCKAIRDAWGLEKKTDIYPWEQYLEKPIAAKK